MPASAWDKVKMPQTVATVDPLNQRYPRRYFKAGSGFDPGGPQGQP